MNQINKMKIKKEFYDYKNNFMNFNRSMSSKLNLKIFFKQ